MKFVIVSFLEPYIQFVSSISLQECVTVNRKRNVLSHATTNFDGVYHFT